VLERRGGGGGGAGGGGPGHCRRLLRAITEAQRARNWGARLSPAASVGRGSALIFGTCIIFTLSMAGGGGVRVPNGSHGRGIERDGRAQGQRVRAGVGRAHHSAARDVRSGAASLKVHRGRSRGRARAPGRAVGCAGPPSNVMAVPRRDGRADPTGAARPGTGTGAHGGAPELDGGVLIYLSISIYLSTHTHTHTHTHEHKRTHTLTHSTQQDTGCFLRWSGGGTKLNPQPSALNPRPGAFFNGAEVVHN
jgi:hypothetical protein